MNGGRGGRAGTRQGDRPQRAQLSKEIERGTPAGAGQPGHKAMAGGEPSAFLAVDAPEEKWDAGLADGEQGRRPQGARRFREVERGMAAGAGEPGLQAMAGGEPSASLAVDAPEENWDAEPLPAIPGYIPNKETRFKFLYGMTKRQRREEYKKQLRLHHEMEERQRRQASQQQANNGRASSSDTA